MIVEFVSSIKQQDVATVISYVQDPSKTIEIVDCSRVNSINLNESNNLSREIHYVSNSDKTLGEYITGVNCSVNHLEQDFILNAKRVANAVGRELNPTENLLFHLAQSFPEDIDINPQLQHQCGVELAQKISDEFGGYQFLVCSHIKSEVKEDGLEHGKCKHNHILMSAYRYYDSIDFENEKKVKYDSRLSSYYTIQALNDAVALDHNLPIIIQKSGEKSLNKKEYESMKSGKNFKHQTKCDINQSIYESKNWNQFKKKMEEKNYHLTMKETRNSEGKIEKYIVYQTPDNNFLTDNQLGNSYTQAAIKKVFRDKNFDFLSKLKEKKFKDLNFLMDNHDHKLFYRIPIQKKYSTNTYVTSYPVDSIHGRKKSKKYAESNDYIEIIDSKNKHVGYVESSNLLAYYEKKDVKIRSDAIEKLNEEIIFLNKNGRIDTVNQVYYDTRFKNKKNEYYRVPYYYNDLYKKSVLELLIILLYLIVTRNDVFSRDYRPDSHNPARNETVRRIYSSLDVIEKYNLNSLHDLKKIMNKKGSKISVVKRYISQYKHTISEMDDLISQLNEYNYYLNLKNMGLNLTKDEIRKFDEICSKLAESKLINDNDINDFFCRYKSNEKRLSYYEELLKNTNVEYSQLKRLERTVMQAVNYDKESIEPETDLNDLINSADERKKSQNDNNQDKEEIIDKSNDDFEI